MQRETMTILSREKRGSGALRAFLLAGASLAVLAAAPAMAQVAADERVYRQEALSHARAIEAAWRRLETFILEESAGPTELAGGAPPSAAGWQADWTVRGLEARYCEDTLLVYLAPARLKGVGRDHRAVHAAPQAYGDGRDPVLHWLENGRAEGGAGRASVALPDCLSPLALGPGGAGGGGARSLPAHERARDAGAQGGGLRGGRARRGPDLRPRGDPGP